MKRVCAIVAALAIAAMTAAFAEKTPVPGLHAYKLDNGLELFVLENHAVPLDRKSVV